MNYAPQGRWATSLKEKVNWRQRFDLALSLTPLNDIKWQISRLICRWWQNHLRLWTWDTVIRGYNDHREVASSGRMLRDETSLGRIILPPMNTYIPFCYRLGKPRRFCQLSCQRIGESNPASFCVCSFFSIVFIRYLLFCFRYLLFCFRYLLFYENEFNV